MTQIYKVGTATVTNGSTAVAGTDTGWAVAGVTGGLFTRNGMAVPIESVADDDTLVLALPWPGANSTGLYAIMRESSSAASVVDLYDRLRQATIALSLHSIHPSAIGTLADRNALTLGAEDTQFVFLRLETGQPDEYYRWGGAAWVGPFPVRGPAGADSTVPGPPGEGFSPAGAWAIGTTYASGDYVSFGGRTFVSLADGNIGNEPPSADVDDSFWMWAPTLQGPPGPGGAAAYVYVAYASAGDGTGFTLTFDAGLDYIAVLSTDTAIAIPVASDFVGLWKNYKGGQGDPGNDGWSPVLALISDGNRRVLQVADWVGGEGVKPATGDYVGASGLTPTIGDAIDIRGPAGSGAGDVTTSGSAAADRIVVYSDATGDVIKDGGVAISDLATSAQGALADSAVQPGTLGTAAARNVGVSAGNVPELGAGGKLDAGVIPAVAITDIFVVANQAAMLALTAETGDIAIRTDLNKSFALQTNSPATLADWKELRTPTDAVLSVAGLTGSISGSALKTALAIAQADVSGLGTGSSPQFAGINLGHASDTTLTRSAAGTVAVEGVDLVKVSGPQTLSGKTLQSPLIDGTVTEDVFVITDAPGYAINPSDASIQRWTLTASRTPGAPHANWANGKSVTLFIDDGAAYTINWATMGVVWKGGSAPTLPTTGYAEVNITMENGVLRGVHIGDFAS